MKNELKQQIPLLNTEIRALEIVMGIAHPKTVEEITEILHHKYMLLYNLQGNTMNSEKAWVVHFDPEGFVLRASIIEGVPSERYRGDGKGGAVYYVEAANLIGAIMRANELKG